MLSEQEIKRALRADRVADVALANPHGPLGWEQLARIIAQLATAANTTDQRVVSSVSVSAETWNKLKKLADDAARSTARPVSVSEIASAILQHYVGAR